MNNGETRQLRPAGYRFGQYFLDLKRHQLFHDEERVGLRRKVFELLTLLVENQGRVVSKEEIRLKIWPDRSVEEGNISQCIYTLRRIFADKISENLYIQTLPGEGYIFSEPVVAIFAPLPDHEVAEGEDGDLPEEATMVATRSSAASRIRQPAVIIVILAGLLVATYLIRLFLTGDIISESRHLRLEIVKEAPLTTRPGMETNPAFSPDGRMLAFAAEDESDNLDIYIKDIINNGSGAGTPEVRITAHPDSDYLPRWSPDGKRIAFLRSSRIFGDRLRLMTIPVTGGEEREIGKVWGGLDWSPDGKWLAVSDNDKTSPVTIFLIAADGTERRRAATTEIANDSKPGMVIYDNLPKFSPDGRKLAFVRWSSDQAGDIYILDIESGRTWRATDDSLAITDLTWSPDQRTIFLTSTKTGRMRLWQVEVPDNNGPPRPSRIVNDIVTEIDHFSLTADWKRIAYNQSFSDTDIVIGKTDGSSLFSSVKNDVTGPCRITSSRRDDTQRFSTDGSVIVFVSTRSGWDEIWMARADCSEARQITNFRDGSAGSPRWSTDNSSIVFDRHVGNKIEIYTIGVDGSNLRRLTNNLITDNMPSFSRNSLWVYFSSDRISVKNIFKKALTGAGEEEQMTTLGGRDALESLDGRHLYFTRNDELWLKDLENGQESPVAELKGVAVRRNWDLSSNAIYYIAPNSLQQQSIHRLDLRTRQIRQVTEFKQTLNDFLPAISVTPDEKRMAVGFIGYRGGDIIIAELK